VTDYPNWETMPPSLMWDNMKSDLMHGTQYLVDHADTLGIDASRAVTTGSSARDQGHSTLDAARPPTDGNRATTNLCGRLLSEQSRMSLRHSRRR